MDISCGAEFWHCYYYFGLQAPFPSKNTKFCLIKFVSNIFFFWTRSFVFVSNLLHCLLLLFKVFFFCHCRYIYDIISELCYPPVWNYDQYEIIGQSSLSPMSVSEDWKAKKSPKHWLVSNCQTAAPENRILLTGTFAFYFLPWNAQCVQSGVNASTI